MDQGDGHISSGLKAGDLARYYSSLSAPEDLRAPLQALYAFDLETLAVRDRVSEPLPGEIRLQWWRDTIAGLYRGEASGHPVADALGAAIGIGRLPQEAFQGLLEARITDLYDDPPIGMEDLEGHFGATFSAVVQMACLILARGEEAGSAAAAGHAGVASGIAWLMRNLGRNAARGQPFVPFELLSAHGANTDMLLRGKAGPELAAALGALCAHAGEHLDSARRAARALPVHLRPAFAHLSVTAAELRLLARRVNDPFRPPRLLLPLGMFLRVQRGF